MMEAEFYRSLDRVHYYYAEPSPGQPWSRLMGPGHRMELDFLTPRVARGLAFQRNLDLGKVDHLLAQGHGILVLPGDRPHPALRGESIIAAANRLMNSRKIL